MAPDSLPTTVAFFIIVKHSQKTTGADYPGVICHVAITCDSKMFLLSSRSHVCNKHDNAGNQTLQGVEFHF